MILEYRPNQFEVENDKTELVFLLYEFASLAVEMFGMLY